MEKEEKNEKEKLNENDKKEVLSKISYFDKLKLAKGLALTQKKILEKNEKVSQALYDGLCETENDMEGVIYGYTIFAKFLGHYNEAKEVRAILESLNKCDWEKLIKKNRESD